MYSALRRVFSGIQPTGVPQLGNYLGALSHWVRLQDTFDSVLYSVVDLHSLTTPQDPIALRSNVHKMAASLLACGVDPARSIVFQQSQGLLDHRLALVSLDLQYSRAYQDSPPPSPKVPEHAELSWLLGCSTPIGWLKRMTQWKSKVADSDSLMLGLFSYPVLMAADILLYSATHVPVGEDQLQHLELARDIARSFNARHGALFQEPQPLLAEVPRVMSLRNPLQKMSKSDSSDLSRINLTDTPDQIRTKISKAVTDSTGSVTFDPENRPGVSNLVRIYASLTSWSCAKVCEHFSGRQTVDLKMELGEVLVETLSPVQRRLNELLTNEQGHVEDTLASGRRKARELAAAQLDRVKDVLGIV